MWIVLDLSLTRLEEPIRPCHSISKNRCAIKMASQTLMLENLPIHCICEHIRGFIQKVPFLYESSIKRDPFQFELVQGGASSQTSSVICIKKYTMYNQTGHNACTCASSILFSHDQRVAW